MANFNIVAASKALTQNAEWSIAQNAAFSTATPRTTSGKVTFTIDLSTLVAGDVLEIRVYRGVNSTTPVQTDLATIKTATIFSGELQQVTNAWDVTLKLTTATGRTAVFEVIQDTNDVNMNTITAGAIAAASFAAGAITSTVIAANAIGASQIATAAITNAKFAANAIDSAGLSATAVTEIVSGVWDEVLTGVTHNVTSSAGKRLRQLNAVAIRADIAQGGGNGINQIQLDAAASAIDGIYDKNLIVITAGPGTGQSRLILRYEGATRIATVERNWRDGQVPTSASEFQIFGAAYLDSITEGLATAGGANTITLDVGSPDSDDVLVESTITICSGTGEGQSRRIVGYAGTTHVATVAPPWSIAPDTTTGYIVLADSEINPATLAPLSASLANIQTDSNDIQARLPAALDGAGNMKAGVQTIAAGAITAAAAASDYLAAVAGAVWGLVSEGAETVLHQLRLLRARELGRATVRDGDGTYTFRDAADTKDRLVMARSGTARTTTTADGT